VDKYVNFDNGILDLAGTRVHVGNYYRATSVVYTPRDIELKRFDPILMDQTGILETPEMTDEEQPMSRARAITIYPQFLSNVKPDSFTKGLLLRRYDDNEIVAMNRELENATVPYRDLDEFKESMPYEDLDELIQLIQKIKGAIPDELVGSIDVKMYILSSQTVKELDYFKWNGIEILVADDVKLNGI